MRSLRTYLLLLILIAVPAALLLLHGPRKAPSGNPTTAIGAETPPTPAPEAAPALPGSPDEADAAGRSRLHDGLLLRALRPDGKAPVQASFFVKRGQEVQVLDAPGGSRELPPGDQALLVAALADDAWSPVTSLSAEDRSTREELVLRTDRLAASVHFQVQDANGGPVDSFTVRPRWTGLLPGENWELAKTGPLYTRARPSQAGTHGQASLAGLPPGIWSFTITSPGHAPERLSARLESGAHSELSLVLHPGSFLRGRCVDEQGQAVADARLVLAPPASAWLGKAIPAERLLDLAPPGGSAESAPDGSFRIGPVAAGKYHLVARAPGHPFWSAPDDLQLAVGQTRDAGMVRFAAGHELRVHLLRTEDRAPVRDGWVKATFGSKDSNLLQQMLPGHELPPVEEQPGVFLLASAPAEALTLRCGAPDRATQVVEVEREAFQTGTLEVLLPPGLSLVGQVVDARDGSPIAGAQVLPLPADQGLIQGLFSSIGAKARNEGVKSDDAGHFALSGLAPGSWLLGVEAEDFASAQAGPYELVAGTPLPEIRIELRQGASLAVTVLDDQGQAIPNCLVSLFDFSGKTSTHADRTGAEGRILFEHLAAGTYQVQAFPKMSTAAGLGMLSGDFGGMSTLSAFVEIEEDAYQELQLGGARSSATLEGYVTLGEAPAEGLTVMLTSGGGAFSASNTDESGHYRIEEVAPGSYLLMIGSFGIGSGSGWSGSVEVPESGGTIQKDVELPLALLRVHLVDGRDGSPATGVPVVLRTVDSSPGGGYKTTDSQGVVEFPYLTPGDYLVSAGPRSMPLFGGGKGLATQIAGPFQVDAHTGVLETTLTLEAGATLEVQVLGTDGLPVAGAGVFPISMDGQPLTLFAIQATDRNGELRLRGLPGGPLRILARKTGGGQAEREVQLQAGRTTQLVVHLETGCMLAVLVVDREGHARGGVQALVLDRRGAPVSTMMVGSQAMSAGMAFLSGGEQRLGPLAPGRYTLVLADLGGHRQSQELVIPPGETEKRLTVEFTP